MNMKRFTTTLALSGLTLIAGSAAAGGNGNGGGIGKGVIHPPTCEYFVPDKVVSGDEWYGAANWGWCTQDFLNNFVDIYGMEGEDWEGAWGWKDACNPDKPFARVVTARQALFLSSANPKLNGDSFNINDPFIDWAGRYVSSTIDELNPNCGFGNPYTAQWINILGDDWIELYILAKGRFENGFFFGRDVPGRASTLIHESRHWDGCRDHTDNEQDSFFGDGGAYSWQAVWLQWYATAAINAPDELRCSAQCTANAILTNKFELEVTFRVTGAPNCGC
jgi:hypothetical protein